MKQLVTFLMMMVLIGSVQAKPSCADLEAENHALREQLAAMQQEIPKIINENKGIRADNEHLLNELQSTKELVRDLQQRLEQLLKLQAGLLQQLEKRYRATEQAAE